MLEHYIGVQMKYIHEKSGVTYSLLCIANQGLNDCKWVETAVYQSEKDLKIYARPYADFKKKFKEVTK